MSLQTACPSCGSQFVVGEAQLGKKVRCKHCQKPFTVAAGGEPEEAPRPRRAKKKSKAAVVWLWVILGLLLAGGGTVAVILLTGSGGVGQEGKGDGPTNAPLRRLDLPYTAKDLHRFIIPRPGGETILAIVRDGQSQRPVHFDRWSCASGQKLGSLDLSHMDFGTVFDVSPDGTLIALGHSIKHKHAVTIWSLTENRAIVKDWQPSYRRREEGGRHSDVPVSWVCFLDQSRVLVVYEDAAADVVSLPQMQSGKLVDLVRPQGGVDTKYQAGVDRAAGVPLSFTLSADRRLFAYWNGDGYSFYDTQTGKPRGQTAALGTQAGGKVVGGHGIAFSPDGSRLAAHLRVAPDPGQPTTNTNVLVCWDTATGQRTSLMPVRFASHPQFQLGTIRGVIWWGPKHVLLIAHGQGFLFDAERGAFACSLTGDDAKVNDALWVIPGTADGNVWHYRLEAGKYCLRAYRLPEAEVAHLAASPHDPPFGTPLQLRLDRVSVVGFNKQ